MTEQQMLDRIKELEEENSRLKSVIKEYEEKIKELEETILNQSGNNSSLVEHIEKYKQDLKQLRTDVESLLDYQNFLEILVDIYESNSHYENIEDNLELSLTNLLGRFKARSVTLLKKNDLGQFKINYTAKQYEQKNDNKRDEAIEDLVQNFDFAKEFSDLIPILNQSKAISPTPHYISDCKTSEICNRNGIEEMVVTPIITAKGLEYILAVINPEKKLEPSKLTCVAIAYIETFNRVHTQKLIEKLSITDNLTGLYDHTYFTRITQELEENKETHIGYVMIDLFRLKHVNDTYGHEAGDTYIKTVASIINKHFDKDYVFRLGGDEFSVITVHKDLDYITSKINDINIEIEQTEFKTRDGHTFEARVDTGVDFTTEVPVFKELAHNADIRMNDNKNEYYMTHGLNRRK